MMEPWRGPTQNHINDIIIYKKIKCITAHLFDYQTVGHQKPLVNDDHLDSLRPTVYILNTFKKEGEGIIEGIKETPAMRNPIVLNR